MAEGEVTVIAVHALGTATTRCPTGRSDLALVLSAPVSSSGIGKAAAVGIILNALGRVKRHYPGDQSEILALLEMADSESAEKVINENRDPRTPITVGELIERRLQQYPVCHADWLLTHLNETGDACDRIVNSSRLALALVAGRPGVALSLYEKAIVIDLPGSYSDGECGCYLAALAARLGRNEEAKKWLRRALASLPASGSSPQTLTVSQIDGMDIRDQKRFRYLSLQQIRTQLLQEATKIAGQGSAALVEQVYDTFDSTLGYTRQRALVDALPGVVKFDPAGALHLLERAFQSEAGRSGYEFSALALPIIEGLSERDPQAALALVRRTGTGPQALAAAAMHQPAEQAVALLQEAAAGVK